MKTIRSINELDPSDLESHPVWEFVNDDALGETAMRPVKRVPVERLGNRLVGTRVTLSMGDRVWALLGNVKAENPALSEHLLTISIAKDGKWFTLARYHDRDVETNGPAALARFLDRTVDAVFPISYDISAYCKGVPEALKGVIRKEPITRLSRTELIKLSVPRL